MNLSGITALYPAHLAELHQRYARALAAVGLDAVVLHSGLAVKKTRFDDQWWPLRPTPHFSHWLPLSQPSSAVIVSPAHRPTLFTPATVDFWENPPEPESRHYESHFDHICLNNPDCLRESLPRGRVGFIGDDETQASRWGLESVNDPVVLAALDALRVHKTPYEIACLTEANRRAAVGHLAVRDLFFSGDTDELQLHLAFLRATRQDDPETPYKNIIAQGTHAATLHHVSYSRPKHRTEATSLLVDAGAGCLGYGSDITRTWARGHGATSDLFVSLVEAVEKLQRELVQSLRHGEPYETLHDRAHHLVAEALGALKILRCTASEAVAKGLTRGFFPHGLGHSLGLQTHDVGCAVIKPRSDNPFLRNTSTISPGQVFTIEPGVYVIPSLLDPLREGDYSAHINWATVDALRHFGGVRIEDDIVVTHDGWKNLTRDAIADLPIRA